MAARYAAKGRALDDDQRRQRIKTYRGWIDRWKRLEHEFGIDLHEDISDLERWIRVLMDTNEQRPRVTRTKRRAGSGN